ncbi:hypothetical protein TNCV_3272391 [Trichonephila clavipes]|nr:hypothetical protein TNCV_3272391 [Trichonephila clavipes]
MSDPNDFNSLHLPLACGFVSSYPVPHLIDSVKGHEYLSPLLADSFHPTVVKTCLELLYHSNDFIRSQKHRVAAIRDISRSCLDPNDFTVLNCIVKGHASLSPPSLRLRLRSRFTLLAT